MFCQLLTVHEAEAQDGTVQTEVAHVIHFDRFFSPRNIQHSVLWARTQNHNAPLWSLPSHAKSEISKRRGVKINTSYTWTHITHSPRTPFLSSVIAQPFHSVFVQLSYNSGSCLLLARCKTQLGTPPPHPSTVVLLFHLHLSLDVLCFSIGCVDVELCFLYLSFWTGHHICTCKSIFIFHSPLGHAL